MPTFSPVPSSHIPRNLLTHGTWLVAHILGASSSVPWAGDGLAVVALGCRGKDLGSFWKIYSNNPLMRSWGWCPQAQHCWSQLWFVAGGGWEDGARPPPGADISLHMGLGLHFWLFSRMIWDFCHSIHVDREHPSQPLKAVVPLLLSSYF